MLLAISFQFTIIQKMELRDLSKRASNALAFRNIDIVLMHDAEDYIPEAIDNAFPVLADLKRQGLIKAIGLGMNYVEPALKIMKGY